MRFSLRTLILVMLLGGAVLAVCFWQYRLSSNRQHFERASLGAELANGVSNVKPVFSSGPRSYSELVAERFYEQEQEELQKAAHRRNVIWLVVIAATTTGALICSRLLREKAVPIIRYVPAVLFALLVVAWVFSVYGKYGVLMRGGSGHADRSRLLIGSNFGSIIVSYHPSWPEKPHAAIFPHAMSEMLSRQWCGEFKSQRKQLRSDWYVPIPLMLSVLLPFTIGPLTRFRFPLWSYFAWTALVAAELTYYLR
jgi:hypothetical protein